MRRLDSLAVMGLKMEQKYPSLFKGCGSNPKGLGMLFLSRLVRRRLAEGLQNKEIGRVY